MSSGGFEVICQNCRGAVPSEAANCPHCGAGRYFTKILSTLILFIGFAMVGWTRQERGLHDFVAGTLVVRG